MYLQLDAVRYFVLETENVCAGRNAQDCERRDDRRDIADPHVNRQKCNRQIQDRKNQPGELFQHQFAAFDLAPQNANMGNRSKSGVSRPSKYLGCRPDLERKSATGSREYPDRFRYKFAGE